MTEEQASFDNGGGGNWGSSDGIDLGVDQIKTVKLNVSVQI